MKRNVIWAPGPARENVNVNWAEVNVKFILAKLLSRGGTQLCSQRARGAGGGMRERGVRQKAMCSKSQHSQPRTKQLLVLEY